MAFFKNPAAAFWGIMLCVCHAGAAERTEAELLDKAGRR
jgi:hypothetical protein